ncbi:MAG: hypothetical protein ACLFQK_00415 [Fibrobacterota bacterium]
MRPLVIVAVIVATVLTVFLFVRKETEDISRDNSYFQDKARRIAEKGLQDAPAYLPEDLENIDGHSSGPVDYLDGTFIIEFRRSKEQSGQVIISVTGEYKGVRASEVKNVPVDVFEKLKQEKPEEL